MTVMTGYVIDTYAWVEYFLGSDMGAKAKQYIQEGRATTPSIVLTELRRWFLREIDAGRRTEREMKKCFEFIESTSRVTSLTSEIAIQAGELDFLMKKRIRGWPLADSVIYATARLTSSSVVSGDPHFEHLEDVVFLQSPER